MRSLSCRLGVLVAICLGAAAGSASAQPNLVIVKLHTNPFTQGQVGATYFIGVHNFGTGPTAGTVTVTDTLPAGLTATAFAGPGWTCTLTPLACTRSDVLAGAGTFPTLTLTVNVAINAPASVTNVAQVSGGGDTTPDDNRASDLTDILPAVPVMPLPWLVTLTLLLVATAAWSLRARRPHA